MTTNYQAPHRGSGRLRRLLLALNYEPPRPETRRLRLALLALAVVAGTTAAVAYYWTYVHSEAKTVFPASDAVEKAEQKNADLDGDGSPDVVYKHDPSDTSDPSSAAYLVVVYGSKNGPDPGKRVVFKEKDLDLGPLKGKVPPSNRYDPDDNGPLRGDGQPAVADLDGDGNSDILLGGNGVVLWGSPKGPQPGSPGELGLVKRPDAGEEYATTSQPVTGDFDGDGHDDLATYDGSADGLSTSLAVLKGPFKRDGSPAATVERSNPLENTEEGFLTTGDVNGDRATDLVVHEMAEEDAPSVLLTGGARTETGLSNNDRELPEGNEVVFGDFDGDKRRDIAIGNSGIPDDEDVDAPSVRGWVDVIYGKAPDKPKRIVGGRVGQGFGYGLATADADGDGIDDLTVELSTPISQKSSFQVLHGSADGLSSKPWRTTERKTKSDKHSASEIFGARNYDTDENTEIVLVKSLTGAPESHWWFTDGTDRNELSFTMGDFT
ncbi:VCBS repeat-containing protein [Streptomyces sp. HNM0575]|uniref:VCBS repeat-containing protein n=1 Tax=Streptomyces sp. HNM0575 TaxID=2716338 RepID=UPI00145CB4FE|nr:VCBS repeat-containing protein [Streptomyces sp. HNM0575]NLU71809.1 VCBS repeat-containing protein [Streptomyces sp. HNM0575]